MSTPYITRTYLLEPHPVTRDMIRQARPDLEVIEAPKGSGVTPAEDEAYAIISFGGGERINRFSQARWVHCAGAGYDKLAASMEFTPPVVTRTVGMLGHQMAEYVLAYCLRQSQNMARREELQREREWNNKEAQGAYAFEQSALVFGTGPMGVTIAEYLSHLEIETVGVSHSGTPKHPFDTVVKLEELALVGPERIDYMILVLPDNASTRGLIDSAVLSQFRKALLINVGRGSALPEADLVKALDGDHLCHAVLDVQETEPLPADSTLWRDDRITITPHVSGGTRPEDIATAFLESLEALEKDETPELLVTLS